MDIRLLGTGARPRCWTALCLVAIPNDALRLLAPFKKETEEEEE
jgi:hypothetical protein